MQNKFISAVQNAKNASRSGRNGNMAEDSQEEDGLDIGNPF